MDNEKYLRMLFPFLKENQINEMLSLISKVNPQLIEDFKKLDFKTQDALIYLYMAIREYG